MRLIKLISLVLLVVVFSACKKGKSVSNLDLENKNPIVPNTVLNNDSASSNPEVDLVRYLSICINTFEVIDEDSLNIFPSIIGLTSKEIMEGEWGSNTQGRFFMLTVRKKSNSGKTVGLFKVAFDLERRCEETFCNHKLAFAVRRGEVFGTAPKGLISVYDLRFGDFRPSLSDLYRGKKIGEILSKYIEEIESSGRGGEEYTKKARETYDAFENMEPKDRPKIFFNSAP